MDVLFKKTFVALSCSSILSGCAMPQMTSATNSENKMQSESRSAFTDSYKSRPTIIDHKEAFLLGERIDVDKKKPDFFNRPVYFYQSGDFESRDLAAWVTETIGIPASVDPSIFVFPKMASQQTGPGQQQGRFSPMSSPMGGMGGAAGGQTFMPSVVTDPSYRGTFEGFMNLMTARMGVYWEYTGGRISIFRTKTEVIEIPVLSAQTSTQGGITTMSSTGAGAGGSSGGAMPGGGGGMSGGAGASPMSSGGSTGGSSGSSTTGGGITAMTSNTNLDYWAKIEKTASGIAGSGATVISDPSYGIVAVTATPPQILRVEQWAKQLREQFQKQVAIEVKVYNVNLQNEDNLGFNPAQMLYNNSGRFGFSLASAGLPAVVSGTTPMTFGASVVNGNGALGGSSMALQLLSTMGNTTELYSRSGVTLNGQILAFQEADTQGYLASSGAMLAAGVGSQTTLTPGFVVTGFTGSFLPKVIDGQISINFNLTISNLISMATFTSGSGATAASIQSPQTVSTTLEQIINLKPGQTLILTGYRDKAAHTINNGTVTPTNYSFGGGVDSGANDSVIAVVLSAKLM